MLATWVAEIRRTVVWGQPGTVQGISLSKITRVKWSGSVVQAVERLLFKSWVQTTDPPNPPKLS
jgi:hypothetical protein